MLNVFLLIAGIIWGGWAGFNLLVFLAGLVFAKYDSPTFDGLRVHIPGRFVVEVTQEELAAAVMHELGHKAKLHVWENLLKLLLFCPVSIRRRMKQEIEADLYVIDSRSLASFLRKTSVHPFDQLRATMLEARAARAVPITGDPTRGMREAVPHL